MARQGGVHFSYLVVALVICLGLVVFIVLQNSQYEELNGKHETTKSELNKQKTLTKNRTQELNRARTILGGEGNENPAYKYFEEFLLSAENEWKEASGSGAASSFASLEEFCRDSMKATKYWRHEHEIQRAIAESSTGKIEENRGTFDQIAAEKEEELTGDAMQAMADAFLAKMRANP